MKSTRTVLMAAAMMVALSLHATTKQEYVLNVPEENGNFPVVVPGSAAQSVYVDAECAIRITSIYADGHEVRPDEDVPANAPTLRTVDIRGATPLYQLLLRAPRCWVDLTVTPGHFRMLTFRIPEGAKLIEMSYLVRIPGKHTSEAKKITFIVSNDRYSVLGIK